MLDRYGEEQPEHFSAGAVALCEMCDDNGYRGHLVCDHIDYQAAARRGMDMIRQALKDAKQRKENEQ
jgi:hypothetical protein